MQICRAARKLADDGIIQIICLHDHGLLPGKEHEIGKEYVLTRTGRYMFGFTAKIGHAESGARGGANMVLLCEGEIKMKQTTEDRGTARMSLEWRDLEYDIAYMCTRDDGSKKLSAVSYPQRGILVRAT